MVGLNSPSLILNGSEVGFVLQKTHVPLHVVTEMITEMFASIHK